MVIHVKEWKYQYSRPVLTFSYLMLLISRRRTYFPTLSFFNEFEGLLVLVSTLFSTYQAITVKRVSISGMTIQRSYIDPHLQSSVW